MKKKSLVVPVTCKPWGWSHPSTAAPSDKERREVWYYNRKSGSREFHLDVYDGEKYIGHMTFVMPKD